jgi:hypothetical protein
MGSKNPKSEFRNHGKYKFKTNSVPAHFSLQYLLGFVPGSRSMDFWSYRVMLNPSAISG